MLQYYKYPLKIWLTSALLGTILFYTVEYYYAAGPYRDELYQLNELSFYLGVTFILAMLVSIPCWLCLWYIYSWFTKKRKVKYLKLKMLLISELLCFALFTITSAFDHESALAYDLDLKFSFMIALAIAVFIYPAHKTNHK